MEKIIEADPDFRKVLHALLRLNLFTSKDGVTITGVQNTFSSGLLLCCRVLLGL
jgi:hypothetical protein